jgi:hypothetical protein
LLILAVVVKTSFGKEVFNGTSALDKVWFVWFCTIIKTKNLVWKLA